MKAAVGIATRGGTSLVPIIDALTRQSIPPAVIIVATTAPPSDADRLQAREHGITTRFVTTVTPGYSVNRNAVLEAAESDDVTHLCWIDDDEVPEPDWLAELIRVSDEHDAAITLGPVRRLWPDDTPAWIRRANLPERADYDEGPCDDAGRTGNCLFDLRAVALRHLRFDAKYNLTGGEDVEFIRRARSLGAVVAWAPRAVVHESASREMFNSRWYVERAWRTGRVSGAQTRTVDAKRLPKAVLLAAAGIAALRADLLLRSAWETVFLAGQARGRLLG